MDEMTFGGDRATRYGEEEPFETRAQATVAPDEPDVVAPAPPRKRRAMWPWFVAAALVLALLGVWASGVFSQGDTEVPNVVGIDLETAISSLEDAGLVAGDIGYDESYDQDRFADGQVTEQQPGAGVMVSAGDEVDLVVAGSELNEVPDIVGLSESEAITVVQDAGFDIGDIRREFSEEAENGEVIDQAPRAGSEAPEGSPVTLVISKGMETLTAPNVVGLSQADARARLEDAGLLVEVLQEYSETVAPGEVMAQSPEAGVAVEKGTSVTITVSQGEQIVTMPNVVTMEQQAAIEMLEDLGLQVTVRTQVNVINAGRVIAQEPDSGATLAPGTRVTITVATEG